MERASPSSPPRASPPYALAIFDFDLDADDTGKIATLETGGSLFFSHRDPNIVKAMSERKRDI